MLYVVALTKKLLKHLKIALLVPYLGKNKTSKKLAAWAITTLPKINFFLETFLIKILLSFD